MTTPNTTGASVEDMDAVRGIIGDWEYSGLTVEALARLIARAREESRREAWNNALVCAENAVFEVARSRKNKRTNEFKLPLQEIEAIRALAVTPTPQGETKEQS